MQVVFDALQAIHPLSKGLRSHLKKIIKTREFSKREHILQAGQVCREIYFIKTGLFRCYSIGHGIDISSWFMKEGDICIAIESFFNQRPSLENIQAMEDGIAYFITYEELQYIYRRFPEFNGTARLITERYYILSEQRSFAMRMQRSHERYLWLLEHAPELLQRVPAKYIASYLGITEVTLSVVRARR